MQKSNEERIALLEGQCDAYMLIIVALIAEGWSRTEHRNERREAICNAVERSFGRIPAGEVNHDHLQTVLAEVERLFGMADALS